MALFLVLMGYIIYFNLEKSQDIINSSYNPRLDSMADRVVRGKILDKDGNVLAETTTAEDGSEYRYYPYGNLYAHVVGSSSQGKSGLESAENFELLTSHAFFLEKLKNEFQDEKNIGDNVITTLNTQLQEAAYNALGSYKGAVVVLEPSSGKILAMVSKPDFDPNTVAENWEFLSTDENSYLLNRATQGAYAPGSTFKLVTALEYMREHGDYNAYGYTCQGEITYDGVTIACAGHNVHGDVSLASSLAYSCNTSFSNIGLSLDISGFRNLCEDMLFNKKLPGSLAGSKSSFTLTADADKGKIMQTAIGQGDTLVSPLHMVFVAGAIANHGVAMEPYVVDHVENDGGVHVKNYKGKEYGELLSASDAALLQDYMRGVVENGTGKKLNGQSYTAYGKTGSAEYNSAGDSHGWFVGYGSKEGYKDIAIAVVVEDGGSGSQSAVPVTKQIFDVYFNK